MRERWLHLFHVPSISARSLAVFRAFLGLALLGILVFVDPIRAVPLDQQHVYSPLVDMDWLQALAASDGGTLTLQVIGCVGALLFALGIVARPSYVVLVTVLLTHATMLLVRRGVHDWDLPIVTLLALLVVPWNDARFRAGPEPGRPASRAYGFAIWLPGLTIGLAFLAAAYAKLHTSGLDWITSGAVKYHFVDDGQNAPVTLGLWIATQPGLAVALSLAAILVETLFILVVFVRRWQARAAFGLVGAGLMAGFYVFQGVRWWPWLMLFAAFLPWERIPRRPPATPEPAAGSRDLTWAHAAVVAVLIAAQAWASYRAIEIEPLLSNYPMYSITYESGEHFERSQARLLFESDGMDITDQVRAAEGAGMLGDIVEQEDAEAGDARSQDLAAFRARYAGLYGQSPAVIDVIRESDPFDWSAGRYLPLARTRLGTVRLAE